MAEPKTKRPGRWKAGESGNPAGRPPGAGEVAKLRASIAERVPQLLAAMMTKALEGDVGAARLLLERAIAPLKAAEQTQALTLPDGTIFTSMLKSPAMGLLEVCVPMSTFPLMETLSLNSWVETASSTSLELISAAGSPGR